jgi:hypothetical protein
MFSTPIQNNKNNYFWVFNLELYSRWEGKGAEYFEVHCNKYSADVEASYFPEKCSFELLQSFPVVLNYLIFEGTLCVFIL